ncbi:MAG: lysozyme [Alphaproteobacteria bacterium]|nr:lysozyme [Alphaproteobacteria bacterium]
MQISNNGIQFIKQMEGCVKHDKRHVIYDDKTGSAVDVNKPLPRGATIGYGHLITPGECFGNGITERAATDLLRVDIAAAERVVQNTVVVPLTQNQYDALVSLAYNIGTKNFTISTVVKYINNPNFHSIKYPTLKSAWMAWNYSHGVVSNGLVNRRRHEWNLFNN